MDEQTATLRKIEAVSMSLEMRGRWIADDCNRLVNLPNWETNAEAELVKAEHQLRRTLFTVQQAQQLMFKLRSKAA